MKQGLLLAVLQVALLLLVAGKARWERGRLPHAWTRAEGWTRDAIVRGRYVRLRLETQVEGAWPDRWVTLEAKEGRLTAKASDRFTGLRLMKQDGRVWLASEVAVYLPEHTSWARKGDPVEVWAEVAVPKIGRPRPIRLGRLGSDGRFSPFGSD